MIRVDYAGPGGSCEGIRSLGLESVGFEFDAAACRTRAAAGHLTIRADLAHYRTPARFTGYWASPPCQTFSAAGKGDGRDQIDDLAAVIHAGDWSAAERFDDRTRHVLDACRTAEELHPEWVAFEQVPAVAPLWHAFTARLRARGYSTWAGVLCAADYGVPQTRRRAILMASRVRPVAPPPPTHAETPGMFGERPWVSMADALGWTGHVDRLLNPGRSESQPNRRTYGIDEPAPTVAFGHDSAGWCWVVNTRGDRGENPAGGWPWLKPATTVAGDPRITARCHHDEGSQGRAAIDAADVAAGTDPGENPIRLTVADALTLQGFPVGYPVQGTRTSQFQQIGNAVPPPLAAAVVAALTGKATP